MKISSPSLILNQVKEGESRKEKKPYLDVRSAEKQSHSVSDFSAKAVTKERGLYIHSSQSERYQVSESDSRDAALNKIFSYAKQWEGTPYGWGGEAKGIFNLSIPSDEDKSNWAKQLREIHDRSGKKTVTESLGVDCSGLMRKVLAIAGVPINMDMTADSMYSYFTTGSNGQSINKPEAGALAFWPGKDGRMTHVAMIGKDNQTIIESRGGRGYDDTQNINTIMRSRNIKFAMPNYPFNRKSKNQFMS